MESMRTPHWLQKRALVVLGTPQAGQNTHRRYAMELPAATRLRDRSMRGFLSSLGTRLKE